jgi:hypothetical protein
VRVPPGKGQPPAGSESCVVVGRPALRSVDSERVSRVMEPRKAAIEGAGTLELVLGSIGAPQGLGAEIPPGSESEANTKGFIQEPGRPHCLRGILPEGPPAIKGPGSRALGVPPPARAKEGRHHGTAERRQRSEVGGAMGSRSALIVPRKRGNRPEGPCGGKGGAGTRDRWRARSRKHRVPVRSQRNCSG